MSAVIMLSKQYNPKKLSFPVYVSEKLDGVAAEFYVPKDSFDGKVLVRSRQNKPILSVQHICNHLDLYERLKPGDSIVGELYTKDRLPFKDLSGLVRQHTNAPQLCLYVYDYHRHLESDCFEDRMLAWKNTADCDEMNVVHTIKQDKIKDLNELTVYIRNFFSIRYDAEGLMIRSYDHLYEPGKRSWGMMKLKQRETVDLEIVDIEEATDEAGNPKGMSGGFKCKYQGSVIGVGPGKLTHAERITAFKNRTELVGTIVEVQYMPDPSYGALREPTVVRFRDDKDEPNEE